MAEERHASFGLSGRGSVWSVDDAWFEGSRPDIRDASTPIAEMISFDACRNDYGKLLEAISSRESATGSRPERVELEYLKVLAQLCKENNFRLTLCNFEHFEKEHPRIINKEKTAVLLDIKYDDFRGDERKSPITGDQYNRNNYGYLLLADLLKGKRPRADIFFVTSYETLPQEIRRMQGGKSSLWPLRTIPFISKTHVGPTEDDSLEEELRAFIKYFKQGIDNTPITEFANALFEAQKFSHPHHINHDLRDGFLLKEEFMVDGGQKAEIESFKALYLYDGKLGGKSDRDLLTRIFISHLKHAGVEAETAADGIFRLPVEPGMLFILCLLDLHKALELDEQSIKLSFRDNGISGVAEIFIPLKTPGEFKSAFFTRESQDGAVNALRRLLACKETVFRNHVNADAEEINSLIDRWKKNRMTFSGKHYNLLARPSFDDRGLTLTWDYALSPPAPEI